MGMTGVSLTAVIVFIFIRAPLKQPDEVTRDLAIGASTKDSVLLKESTELQQDGEEPKEEEKSSIKEDIIKTFKMMAEKKMLLLHMLWAWTAVSQTFQSSIQIPLLTDTMKHTPHCAHWSEDDRNK
jgi:hypothetical protein